MVDISWPSGDEFRDGVSRLNRIIGGRKDVVAQYYKFTPPGKTEEVKGYRPWKLKKVAQDYVAQPGEVIQQHTPYGTTALEYFILRRLDDKTLELHARGKSLLGVYALDNDNCSSFLAADFDDHEGSLDPAGVWDQVRRFAEICDTHEFTPFIERSKSGQGYHVWVFFETPIDAGLLRGLGKWLMEEAEAIRDGESFDVFDRFFPAQSELAEGLKGFGNLIAIPMCGPTAYADGRTAWVDFDNEIILDPFEHLKTIESKRVTKETVDLFCSENEVERLVSYRSTSKGSGPAVVGANVLAGVEEGSRNDNIFKYACQLRRKGISIDEARALVLAAAQNSDFDAGEAETCLQSAWNYPNNEKESSSTPAAKRTRGANVTPDQIQGSVNVEFDDIEIYEDSGKPWPLIDAYSLDVGGLSDSQNNVLCTKPIWVDAITENIDSEYGIRLKFFDLDWRLRAYVLPRNRLHEQGGVLARDLASLGCPIMPGKEKMIARFIVSCEPSVSKRIIAAERLGWFEQPGSPTVFMMPAGPLGTTDKEIVFQPKQRTKGAGKIHIKGDLEEWKREVAERCVGNPMLMFGIMAALAGPLLHYADEQSGGYHFYGRTTAGKTTMLQAAASVWGCGADPQEGPAQTSIRTWYTTGAALEAMAEIHNDSCILLDEISEVEPQELGKIIYSLAGGTSKGRSTADGGVRDFLQWQLLILSTGEKSVKHIINSTGANTKGGQLVRLTDIPVNAGDKHSGVIVTVTGNKAAALSDAIKDAASNFYGIAGPTFVLHILNQLENGSAAKFKRQIKADVGGLEKIIHDGIEGGDVPAEGKRALRRTALVAAAGIMAADAGILPWTTEQILESVNDCRDRWLYELGTERSEEDRGLAFLRSEIFQHMSRFSTPGDNHYPPNRLGIRTSANQLLFEPGTLRKLCCDYDLNQILNTLKHRGWLSHSPGRLTKQWSTPLAGFSTASRPHVYCIEPEFLDGSDVQVQHQLISEPDGGPPL